MQRARACRCLSASLLLVSSAFSLPILPLIYIRVLLACINSLCVCALAADCACVARDLVCKKQVPKPGQVISVAGNYKPYDPSRDAAASQDADAQNNPESVHGDEEQKDHEDQLLQTNSSPRGHNLDGASELEHGEEEEERKDWSDMHSPLGAPESSDDESGASVESKLSHCRKQKCLDPNCHTVASARPNCHTVAGALSRMHCFSTSHTTPSR
jgi:hypothetical protein